MKVVYQNLKAGDVKVEVESPEDLWYLSQVIEPGDTVKGVTLRKVKATAEAVGERRRVFLAIIAEKVDFTESSLRVTGKIIDGPEDVPRGSYHTFAVEPRDTVSVIKDHWYPYQLERLKEAEKSRASILICVFDREDALFALMKRSGFSVLSKLHGSVPKKGYDEALTQDFFSQVVKQLEEYDARYDLDHIVIASPAFWKDEFMKVLVNPDLKRKITSATCSSVSESAIDEVLRRGELHSALKEDRVAREVDFVERLMVEIAKQGAVAYGFDSVENAANAGAIDSLLVTDNLIRRLREEDDFFRLDQVMRSVDSRKGSVVLISSAHAAGKKLDGIGGIGALLRYKLSYE